MIGIDLMWSLKIFDLTHHRHMFH